MGSARSGDTELSAPLKADLSRAVTAAGAAYQELASFLERDLLPHAPAADACGRERYALLSQYFVGATIDLDETYAWGQEELARITAQMAQVAEQIMPGEARPTVKEAIAALDADPAYLLQGTDALQDWMQEYRRRSDRRSDRCALRHP
ncbi:MAG: DUF885 family protein [Dermatophilaceae bacterium]